MDWSPVEMTQPEAEVDEAVCAFLGELVGEAGPAVDVRPLEKAAK